MIRPDLRAALIRQTETLTAGAVMLLGLWIATRGGYLLTPLGLIVGALGGIWAVFAWRRSRFAQEVAAPGLIELDEGRIGYYGAGQGLGGYLALADLAEIRLLTLREQKYWRLKSLDGQAILIPTAAAGGEKLYDAFATLPGIDMGTVTGALNRRATVQSLWKRPLPRP